MNLVDDLEPAADNLIPVPRIALNAEDAAKALGISKRTLLVLVAAGELPYVEAGRHTFLFAPADLAAWVENKKKTREVAHGQHLN